MTPQPVLDMQMTPRGEASTALQPATTAPEIDLALMFQQLAAKPEIPVDKLEALMNMQRSILSDRAKVAFNAAMADAQKTMRPIVADATNPQTRSRYASYAKLDSQLRPIYTAHGFALSFDTADAPAAETIRVVCLVSHEGGHERTYKLDMPADGKGAKGGDVMTKTHAAGAAMSYGMRYLLKMIFNVAVGEDDRDGNDVEAEPQPPKGYEMWLADLSAVADTGTAALKAAWDASAAPLRAFLTKHNRAGWEKLKAKAARAGA
jgi:hypothetical protein